MGRSAGFARRDVSGDASVLRQLAAKLPERYPALFDSASRGPLARHSILVATDGDALWQPSGRAVRASGMASAYLVPESSTLLEAWERWWRAVAIEALPGCADLPWRGGFMAFLGYELAAELEPRLRRWLPPSALPFTAFVLRTPAALVWDEARGRLQAVAEPGQDSWLERLARDVELALAGDRPDAAALAMRVGDLQEDPPEEFVEAVLKAKQHIAAGDIYQANLSRAWRARADTPPTGAHLASLYDRLRQRNPAPFAAWIRWGGVEILSSSPERLLAIRDGWASTRPIAGTRARDAEAGRAEDALGARALVAHPKERAEHVMLIDLGRNDLGRVCDAGSVSVTEFMTIESYAHVHHIVSNVQGRLRPGCSPMQALRAVFPGGTITGCPKLRCMEIIAVLESCPRDAYTGSAGFVGLDGTTDFNILIRTLVLHDGLLSLRAGAGIVADSDPWRELDETRAKARGVLAALQ